MCVYSCQFIYYFFLPLLNLTLRFYPHVEAVRCLKMNNFCYSKSEYDDNGTSKWCGSTIRARILITIIWNPPAPPPKTVQNTLCFYLRIKHQFPPYYIAQIIRVLWVKTDSEYKIQLKNNLCIWFLKIDFNILIYFI